MKSSALITRFLVTCLSIFLLLVTSLPSIQPNVLAQKNTQLSPLASESVVKPSKRAMAIAPTVVVSGTPIWDNGEFDGINGLASEINTFISESRTADDFILTSTTRVGFITADLLSNVNPQVAQLEIYENLGVEARRPVDSAPIATYPFVSATQLGSGFGYPLVRFTFETPGLTLPAGKYWVCPTAVDNGSGRGFFATTGNSVVKLEEGYWKSSYFNIPSWSSVSNTIAITDFAFKVYGAQGVDHSTVYAADTMNNRIQRSTDDGATWQMVGYGAGVTPGRFNAPRGISSSSNDMIIFVADTMNNRIQRSTNGGITWTVIALAGVAPGQVNRPYGLAYDEGADKLYVADTMNNRIQVATNAGTATSPTFSIFAGATAGTIIGKFNQPIGIAVSADSDNVYVSDTSNNRIQVYSISGGTWSIFAGATAGTTLGKVNQPHGIYIDNEGRVYVADRGNNRIQMINTLDAGRENMQQWTMFMSAGVAPGFVNAPCGIVYASSGHVFVGDTANNRVQKKNLMTGVVTIVGQGGVQMGQFYQPTSMR